MDSQLDAIQAKISEATADLLRSRSGGRAEEAATKTLNTFQKLYDKRAAAIAEDLKKAQIAQTRESMEVMSEGPKRFEPIFGPGSSLVTRKKTK